MTDCPQRDERLGWLNDLTVRLEEAIYNFELPQLLRKVEQDIADAQGPGGAIKDVAPFSISHFGNDPADPVCSSFLLLPYLMYLHWADKKIIERHYEAVRGWTLYLHKNSSDGLVDFGYYGDWASPIIYCQEESPVSAITPPAYMSAGFQCLNLKLMGFFASLLGKTQDQQMFGELAQTAVAAFNAKYLDRQKGSYCTGSQACNSFALWLEIVPPEIVPRVAANLAQDVIAKDYHLSTGNICTKYLPEMLAEHGYGDVALKLICQRTYPSWGYMLEHGATTVWERWERETKGGMNSHNHPMNATIGSWFYKYLAGILPDPVRPGFERFFLKPYFLEGIDWVKCRLQTLYGLIEVRWERTAAGIALYAVVPSNSAAQVILPEGYVAEDDQALQLMSGRYRLEIKKLK
jgi:alpha-L-rhamnosidase